MKEFLSITKRFGEFSIKKSEGLQLFSVKINHMPLTTLPKNYTENICVWVINDFFLKKRLIRAESDILQHCYDNAILIEIINFC